jgi:hypothetical protein
MTTSKTPARALAKRRATAAVTLALAVLPAARALETKASGRLLFGSVYRVQANDPDLLSAVNASAMGVPGYGSGANADDANSNYRRGDAVSRSLRGYLDLDARAGSVQALVRVKAWRDYGLRDDPRPWGNIANGYTAGAPLSDRGAERLSRFSGVALGEAWVQQSGAPGGIRMLGRVGLQSLNWGIPGSIPGGLEALNPKDLPALHRGGAAPQEIRVPMPMLFGRIEPAAGVGVEAYYQTGFRATALDMCGSLWSMSDYVTGGCDKVMSGRPLVSDRARLPLGAYQKRLPTPHPGSAEFGAGLTWKSALLGTEFGLYRARYNSRMQIPGLRRSTRAGPPLIAGDPDGQNMAYFTEYPERLALNALTFDHKGQAASVYGEVSYRPNQPFMLAPGDVVPPFLSSTAPSLLRSRVDAVPPGGFFHGYDDYPLAQAQLGVRRAWRAGGVALMTGAEVVVKHSAGLPDQAVLRYGRSEMFGVGAINGACAVTTRDAQRQCSMDGYATATAYGYRLRADARFGAVLPGLDAGASVVFAHDVKGWSGDFLLNQGRKSANVALRFEYLRRYLAEIDYLPIWGGQYNPAADRDTLGLSVGVRF